MVSNNRGQSYRRKDRENCKLAYESDVKHQAEGERDDETKNE